MKNKTILEKADLTVQDLISDGGFLVPAQAKKFIQHLIQEAVLLKIVKVKPMRSKKELIEGISFNSQVLRRGTSAQALPVSDRSKPDFTNPELDAVLFKGQVNLNDEVLEDNIEQGTLKQTVMQTMTERIAFDIDNITANGDTSLTDGFLDSYDGMRKSAVTHITDGGILPISDNLLKLMLKDIPSAARRDKKNMMFLTSENAEIDYRDMLSQRGDSLGVMHHEGWKPCMYGGIPMMPVPAFPENAGVGTNQTDVLLLNPKNWNHGIWRQIRIETQRDALAGILYIVPTIRMNGKYEKEEYIGKANRVKVA